MCEGVAGLHLAAIAAFCDPSLPLKVGNFVTSRRIVKVFRYVLRCGVSGYLRTAVMATKLYSKNLYLSLRINILEPYGAHVVSCMPRRAFS
jgi:hypothetical protein